MVVKHHIGIELITPDIAGDMIAKNRINRRIRPFHVTDLAEAMKRGEFEVTTDAMGVTPTGDILNGQHRLLAVIQSDIAIEQVVVRGISATAFDKIDIGLPRTIGDNLTQMGVEHFAQELGSVLQALWRFEQHGTYAPIGRLQRKASREQLLRELLPRHPRLPNCITDGNRLRRKLSGGIALWVLLYYQITEHDPEATAFFDMLVAGEHLMRGEPVFQLRERLLDRRVRIRPTEFAALVIKAWRLWREGGTVLVLTWRSDEEFPRIDDESKAERERRLVRERRVRQVDISRNGISTKTRDLV